jgi:predicted nucleic acid-binding protein
VKLVVPERGAALVAETWLGVDRRVSSLLLYPETRAAVGRAQRKGRLAPSQTAATHRRIESLWDAIDWVTPTEQLARRAGDLAAEHHLRAYDAVHLASLEDVGDPETLLVSADADLLDAARVHGFPTVAAI